ncbi:MAG: GTP cyclohydrolase I FolE [Chloroflexi bacterium]|nr:GTP cyclohydrolase I FolE [Chloroflexota bacterium]
MHIEHDTPSIEAAVADILAAIGEDVERPGLQQTPRRVAEMYRELFSGIGQDPAEHLAVAFDEGHYDLVVLKDIPFYSMCEHHLVPFFGAASVAYLPSGRVAGLDKIVRALEVLAKRPQLQERLTAQLADALYTALAAQGVAVIIKAEHLCMSMRGVRKPGIQVATSALRGTFSQESSIQREILAQLGGIV